MAAVPEGTPTMRIGDNLVAFPTKYDFYNYVEANRSLGADAFANNPFGVSYQELQGITGEGGGSTTPSGGGSTGGSSGGSTVDPLNQAAIENTRKAIDSLGTEINVGRKNIGEGYDSVIGQYNRDRTRTKSDYDEETVTNTQNLTKNKQNALLAAAQGRRGLRGTLASIGALGGTGSFLADRAVTEGANQDIGGATDTFSTNAGKLDKAWNRFSEEDEDRRREARVARENQETALEGQIAAKRQNFYQKMAELFGDADQNDQARLWLDRAGNLNDVIAAKTRVMATPFTTKAAAFTPGDLAKYLAGAGDMTVGVGGGAPGIGDPGSILFGRRPRRRDEEETA